MRHHQAVLGINGDADVVIGVDAVFIGILFRMVKRVHFGIMFQGQRESFDKYAHYCHFLIAFLQGFTHFLHLSDIQLLMEIKMRNGITFSHRFLHALLKTTH